LREEWEELLDHMKITNWLLRRRRMHR
jgi:hypothetical protein